eukprot:TRINITY_DN55959_c0_g3_i1.p1 TRINITY_DN55959_c0_g3~~TRINITY_DN55959_c0_g3_i1.p1  ORF type:complete len:845 (+),score=184.47 TRINITY_DN55959_c0_g3_i1:67-2535(+)
MALQAKKDDRFPAEPGAGALLQPLDCWTVPQSSGASQPRRCAQRKAVIAAVAAVVAASTTTPECYVAPATALSRKASSVSRGAPRDRASRGRPLRLSQQRWETPILVEGVTTTLCCTAVAPIACWANTGTYPEIDYFLLGVLAGIFGTLSTLAATTFVFLQNLRGDSTGDLSKMESFNGLLMPSFFFRGAADIFKNVRQDAVQSAKRFRETGKFAEIYTGIERSQEQALLQGIEALREQFPRSGTREVFFGLLRVGASSSTRAALSLYEFAARLQSQLQEAQLESRDILNELWSLDEGRCTVSGRRFSEGRRQSWVNARADVLVDKQVAALRSTVAHIAPRPLFARVAAEILARPTYLALIRLFDILRPAEGCDLSYPVLDLDASCYYHGYTIAEAEAIDSFLDQVMRTAVMLRAKQHVMDTLAFDMTMSWKEVLLKVWFERRGGQPCVFEHVFLGNLAEDLSGQPIAGGLHCWLKFYLEEVRGTATYLGYIYNCPQAGLSNSRFVSGKFVWNHLGQVLVKDQGGFFIGVSPEWQLASGTVSYFETITPESAQDHGWETWPGARGIGYTKDVTYDQVRYRKVVCHSGGVVDTEQSFRAGDGCLASTYAMFLGAAFEDNTDTSELDRLCGISELAASLPNWLVTDGFARQEDSQLSEACTRFCVERGCRTLREALQAVKDVFAFTLEDAVAASEAEGYPAIRKLVHDTRDVSPLLMEAADRMALGGPALSEQLPLLLDGLRQQGRRGPRLHQPLRLLLTGHADGAPVADIMMLLELAEKEGGDEAAPLLTDRLALVKKLFPQSQRSKVLEATGVLRDGPKIVD